MDPEAEACQLIPLKNQESFSSPSLFILISCVYVFLSLDLSKLRESCERHPVYDRYFCEGIYRLVAYLRIIIV